MVTGNSINNAIVAGTTIIFDSIGVIEINSTGGAISIGNDADAQAINIGIAGARTVTIGNNTGATSVVVDCGTGALNLGSNAIARTTTLGNTTGASVLALKCGTGDFTLASATGTMIAAADTGEVTMPLQPAFFAYLPTSDADKTGASTLWTLGSATALTEVYDQNADFNVNGTFTAPVTGKYHFDGSVYLYGCTIVSNIVIRLVTSAANYDVWFYRAASALNPQMIISTDVLMTAGDTAYLQIAAAGEAGNTADVAGEGTVISRVSRFSGRLVC